MPAAGNQPACQPGRSHPSCKVHAVKVQQAAAGRRAVAGLQRPLLERRPAKQGGELSQAAVGGGLEALLVVADACRGAERGGRVSKLCAESRRVGTCGERVRPVLLQGIELGGGGRSAQSVSHNAQLAVLSSHDTALPPRHSPTPLSLLRSRRRWARTRRTAGGPQSLPSPSVLCACPASAAAARASARVRLAATKFMSRSSQLKTWK